MFASLASSGLKINSTELLPNHHGKAIKGRGHSPLQLTGPRGVGRGENYLSPPPGLLLPPQPQIPKDGALPTRLFNQVQPQPRPSRPAPSASVVMLTTSTPAIPKIYGMDLLPTPERTRTADSSTLQALSSARTGKGFSAALLPHTTPNTSVQGAENRLMELRNALELKQCNAAAPYIPAAWAKHLQAAGILSKFPNLPHDLQFGFDAGIPTITKTFTPPNRPSITQHSSEFEKITQTEFEKGRYIGPASKSEVECLLGPFQTSPLHLIPKPHKPEKLRLIQNLSFPRAPSEIPSINSAIDSDLFPCTWGSFSVISLLLFRLPPGSQAAVRDAKEAYRTIPIKPSQWPGIVVRLQGEDSFAIDTRNCFGLASGAGCYGKIGDAGTQIMRALGIGPISKWVDDHLFIRIRRPFLEAYNQQRLLWAKDITSNGGELHDGGRLWFSIRKMAFLLHVLHKAHQTL